MSNLERHPTELVADCDATVNEDARGAIAVHDAPHADGIFLIEPRDVPLGGPRAMPVHRTLPQRAKSTIGGWCFLDHYGPDDVSVTGGMRVPPHPHTGLQTVSWLFEGEIEHRDSVGSHAMVRPGELNLMTAGHGISHSEDSTPETTVLHGAQLWLALPDAWREQTPFFERTLPTPVRIGGAVARVFIGELAGASADATVFSPLVGAQLDLDAGATLMLDVRAEFEHGILLDLGDISVEGVEVPHRHLAYVPPGRRLLRLSSVGGARILLLGGEPLGEQIVMWWNFIGRDHDEIVASRDEWQREVIDGEDASGRFGTVAGYPGNPLPAPTMPTVRLKPRR
ncbi:pirin family protein [Humibacter ginsenosidimutans]|uniref:Pirin family protein n=1 Tax=Humibacter ginsenosidimutans TaxID=2599293 RepID=A0A5B8M481_9MICO|nr:pirin family protein [Humibacter ginsenosidimutans]QDZ15116.1 pirin family protein [Humibacter ginsenosidimutans]